MISIYGKHGININFDQYNLPNTAGTLDDLIKHDALEDAISFGALDYFMAKSILGTPGDQFRRNLIQLVQKHNNVTFLVDPDYMVAVANQIIKKHLIDCEAVCTVETILDYSEKSIIKLVA